MHSVHLNSAVLAIVVAIVYLSPRAVLGQSEVFYLDEGISIPWPVGIERQGCDEGLKARAGSSCAIIGSKEEPIGAVFMTLHEGYSLGSREALERHLNDSQGALADIPRIHVMQTRIVREEPLIGLMEVLRKDGTIQSVAGLNRLPVRQTSFLVPTGTRLAQVFVYLPMDGEDAARVYESFFQVLSEDIKVLKEPSVPEKAVSRPTGAMELMPRALWGGGLIAAVVILVALVSAQLRRRRKNKEDELLRAQMESCEEGLDPDESSCPGSEELKDDESKESS